MPKVFLAEGYLEEVEDYSASSKKDMNKSRRLFICVDKDLIIAKTNISDANNKNYTILLDDIQRLNEASTYDEIYLVGETFFEIDNDILEELKHRCYEIWTIEKDYFDTETILKNFTNKN